MLRILFLMRSLEIGGAERQVVELVKNMDHSRFDILVVTFYNEGALRPLIEHIPGIQVTSLGKAGRWDLIPFFWKLVGIVRTYRPDIIQSYLDVPNIFNVLVGKLLRIKTILGVSASFIDFSRYDWTASLVYKIGAFLSHFADKTIANSNAGEKYNIEHGYSAKKISIIHNGIDAHTFRPDKSTGNRIRAQWGISEPEKVVGIVGRIDPMKDHSTFLRAAALVSQQFPDSRFVCIGRGPQGYQDEIKALAASLMDKRKVLWISNCEDKDIPAAYNAFDVLISSSYGEGLPVVLGEAMASGIPCVVTDVGDSGFAVGDTGFVVPPQNPELLANAIGKVLDMNDSERLLLGQKARQRVLDHFSIDKMVSAYEAVYENLAKA
jgi:glycosyltransferase involved in cell wall biosynthesis